MEVEGRRVAPDEIVGPPRSGRTVAYTGDTRISRDVREAAAGADLLIHEATFEEGEEDLARASGHGTAAQAARVALEAGPGSWS